MTTPLPWSHTALQGVQTCPRQHEQVKVLRVFPDQKNAASIWGDEVHRAFEQTIRSKGAVPLPASMAQYTEYVHEFIARPGETLVEQKLAIDINLQPTQFFAKNVWGRGVIDVLTMYNHCAWVDDHKTGKRKKDPQQLILFAIFTFLHHPHITVCHTAYRWLQEGGAKDGETYYRKDLPDLWNAVLPALQDYARCFHSGVFPPKKSGLCQRYCPVTSCEYWGVR